MLTTGRSHGCKDCGGRYILLRDDEDPRLARFNRRLPCFGCGIGWSSLLLGFLCPLIWYCAAILYLCKYYDNDPRERSGLAASAIAALVSTIVVLITLAVIFL
ncbi:unnamed protein product [Musa acuminata subsp. malaccensis]|uniref:(wild Malaysian banana) hypothetical protein n=2 Tax=Musa acuminata TaxID=4641 RepID=A0A8D7B7A4_MUSAM|nr:unnamed protein product [Musa acuminata subsp. malaccensis]